ncbi:MAG: hypothetical protein ACRDOE_06365 [Streptosporangiaceae bacterium]
MEAGADPNDGQTLYNRMFGTNDDHLILLFEYGLGRDTRGPWHRLLLESLESPRRCWSWGQTRTSPTSTISPAPSAGPGISASQR